MAIGGNWWQLISSLGGNWWQLAAIGGNWWQLPPSKRVTSNVVNFDLDYLNYNTITTINVISESLVCFY